MSMKAIFLALKIFREVKVDLTAFGNIHKPIKCGGFIVYLHHYNKNLAAKSGFSKKTSKN